MLSFDDESDPSDASYYGDLWCHSDNEDECVPLVPDQSFPSHTQKKIMVDNDW